MIQSGFIFSRLETKVQKPLGKQSSAMRPVEESSSPTHARAWKPRSTEYVLRSGNTGRYSAQEGRDVPEASEGPQEGGIPFTLNVRLPGQYYDFETGLHYNYFRTYDPATGRYLEADPIGQAGGLNPYEYALNNPLSFVDALGLDVWIEGPSGGEPSFHQSVNVGDPLGAYDSYSFGMNGNGLEGEVYRDTEKGGEIEKYKSTTPA